MSNKNLSETLLDLDKKLFTELFCSLFWIMLTLYF